MSGGEMIDKTFTAGELADMLDMEGPYILRTWKKRNIFQSEHEGGWTRYSFAEALQAGCLWQASKLFGAQLSVITPGSSVLRETCARTDLLTEDRFFVVLGNAWGLGVIQQHVSCTARELPLLLVTHPGEPVNTCSLVINVSDIARALIDQIENPPSDTSDEEADRIIAEAEAAMDARERRSPAEGGEDA